MTFKSKTIVAFALVAGVFSQGAFAASSEVKALQKEWAQAMYNSQDGKEEKLEKLADKARAAVAQAPSDAEAYIWDGIILASYAGARGGLGALGLVKESKSALEKALEIDPNAMQGSAYTSLGSLYYQVPGWPLGFGDDSKAEELLGKGLKVNPNGIDSNYFMADFKYRKGLYNEAQHYLNKALQAPARSDRPLADSGRRQELAELQEKINRYK